MKRFIIGTTLSLFVLLVIGGGVFYVSTMTTPGTPVLGAKSKLDDWILRQVLNIAETYIVPDIGFSDFEYRFPAEFVLKGVTLTAPTGEEVVRAKRLIITFSETPKKGRPIKIERIAIESGALRLIQDESSELMSFKGLLPFVDRALVKNQESVAEEVRLSSVFQIRELKLTNASLVFEPGAGKPPMRLTDITLDLDLQPSADEPGWYEIDTTIDRSPVFDVDVKGAFNLDTFVTQVASLALNIELEEENYSALPPAIQTLLRDHDVRGQLGINASGTIPVREWRQADARATLQLTDINAAAGNGRLPIETGTVELRVANQLAHIEPVELQLLNGQLTATGQADLSTPQMPATLDWRVHHVELREALRTQAPAGKPPSLAGTLDANGNVRADVAAPKQTLRGEGSLSLDKGRLLLIPVVTELAQAMNVLGKVRGATSLTDQATASFTLNGEQLRLTQFNMKSDFISARGEGTINYDGKLNLAVNGGPLESVQDKLGDFGKILGIFTDSILKYHVRGTFKKPKVDVKPLGLGMNTGDKEPDPESDAQRRQEIESLHDES